MRDRRDSSIFQHSHIFLKTTGNKSLTRDHCKTDLGYKKSGPDDQNQSIVSVLVDHNQLTQISAQSTASKGWAKTGQS